MKKIISILIVITVIINVIGFGFLNVNASAVVGVDDITVFVLGLVGSFVIGGLVGLGTEAIEEKAPYIQQNIEDMINSNAWQSGEVIEIERRSSGYIFSPAVGESDPNYEFAEYLCDNLNNNGMCDQLISGFKAEYSGNELNHGEINAELYAETKNNVLQSFNDYINAKAEETAGTTLSELGAVTYPFDFTGPIGEITMPTMSGSVSLDAEGFHFYSPYAFSNKIYFDTTAQALAHGGSYTYEHPSGDLYRPYYQFSSYGWGYYIVYNGDLFYRECQSSDTIRFYEDVVPYTGSLNDYWGCKNSQGVRFSDVFSGDYDVNHYYGGVYYMTEAKDSDHLIPGASYTTDDFTSSSENAESITIPRTDAEDAIGSAIGLNLISGNPTISIGEDGSIEAVDGISLDTIEALVSQLTDGTVQKFDDIEGYLQNIASLLSNGNADRRTIETILDNIRSKVGSIDDINTKLDSIAQALTIDAELEIDKEDIELNAIIGEHTGLVEANDFVSRWELVNQCKQLLNNVLNGNQFSNNPPNFIFYYDSNGDGIKETYNALDLSFLERTLTNENIGDKNRFQTPMTVREFIQLLMIFICYLAFVIKLLRKLPGLVSGGESAAGDGLEIKHIEDAHGTNIRNLIP